jgi:hypothetical protein
MILVREANYSDQCFSWLSLACPSKLSDIILEGPQSFSSMHFQVITDKNPAIQHYVTNEIEKNC